MSIAPYCSKYKQLVHITSILIKSHSMHTSVYDIADTTKYTQRHNLALAETWNTGNISDKEIVDDMSPANITSIRSSYN